MDLPSWKKLVDDDVVRTLSAAEHGNGAEALDALDRLRSIVPVKTPANGNEQGMQVPFSPDEMRKMFEQNILPRMEEDLASSDADWRDDQIFQAYSNFLASASILADEGQIRMRVALEAEGWPEMTAPDFDGVTDAIDLVRRRLDDVNASGEVTEGDPDLSRAAHVERAAAGLDRVRRLIGALRGGDFDKGDDETGWAPTPCATWKRPCPKPSLRLSMPGSTRNLRSARTMKRLS